MIARGIGQAEAATFRLGYVADPHPGHEHVRGRLAIPYLGHDGRVLSVRFRCLQVHSCKDAGHGKYKSLEGEPTRMFNVPALHVAGDEIHLCEGELDCIILTKIGLNAVAVAGNHAWAGRHRRMLNGFSRVWTWADPDKAGSELTNTVTRALVTAKPVRLREGDVTDEYLKHGAEHLLGLLERKEVY
ncbi:toprim domain-containing protein [Haloactinopolyspora alba]|uniref:toprim domain-containing protein n=1 Tax=Haloactinopolyspora alba TaxID=648780 RepID=UPI003B849B6C